MSDSTSRRAGELFDSGLYCAESVLLAMAEARDINSDVLPRIATGFCSGMARTGGTCGAVTGAIMGISLVAGRDSAEESVEATYSLVRSLIAGFEARLGSTLCPGLIGCDLSTAEGQRVYREEHRIEECRRFVEEAARIAEELLHAGP